MSVAGGGLGFILSVGGGGVVHPQGTFSHKAFQNRIMGSFHLIKLKAKFQGMMDRIICVFATVLPKATLCKD